MSGRAGRRRRPAGRCRHTWSGCEPAWSRSGRRARRDSSWPGGDAYALAVSPESVDVGAAAMAASAARAARAAGDLPTARRGFEAALAYWRGEPFEDWRTAGWADGERRRLADVQASTLEARIDVDLDLGQHRELVAELEALIAADPLREGWWIRLMLALYRSDRQADALAAGRRARACLVEELGVDPGPALARTEQVILHQTDDLLLPLPGPVEGAPAGALRAPRPAATACPYRGLAAYERADADLFHGRGRGPGADGEATSHSACRGLRAFRGGQVLGRRCRPGARAAARRRSAQRRCRGRRGQAGIATGGRTRSAAARNGDSRFGPAPGRAGRRPVRAAVDGRAEAGSGRPSSTPCWRCSTTACSAARC